jgi:hypothetical protein
MMLLKVSRPVPVNRESAIGIADLAAGVAEAEEDVVAAAGEVADTAAAVVVADMAGTAAEAEADAKNPFSAGCQDRVFGLHNSPASLMVPRVRVRSLDGNLGSVQQK